MVGVWSRGAERTRTGGALALVVACLLALPVQADAGTIDHFASGFGADAVTYSDSVHVSADAVLELNQVNRVTVTHASRSAFTLTDPGKLIVPDAAYLSLADIAWEVEQCSYRIGGVSCRASDGAVISSLAIQAGKRDDWITVGVAPWPGYFRLIGGEGNDNLRGGPGGDDLHGGPGSDRVDGGPGQDSVSAGSGDLVLVRDGESDTVECGGEPARVLADTLDVLSDCPNAEIE